MLALVRVFFLVFAAVATLGGVMGFVKAKSKPSLIAGVLSGLLLLVAAYLLGQGSAQAGAIVGVVVCLALAGRFVPSFVKTRKLMPAGMMASLSVMGVALTVVLLVGR